MNSRSSVIAVMVLAAALPSSLYAKKKNDTERAVVEKMEAVPCGAKQRGVSGVGSLWASVGVTHVNSDEKLCPQYLLRTDEKEYEIRPTDSKHTYILPVGQEGEFKIKDNRMVLRIPDSDNRKMRTYEVVAIRQTDADSGAKQASDASAAKP